MNPTCFLASLKNEKPERARVGQRFRAVATGFRRSHARRKPGMTGSLASRSLACRGG